MRASGIVVGVIACMFAAPVASPAAQRLIITFDASSTGTQRASDLAAAGVNAPSAVSTGSAALGAIDAMRVQVPSDRAAAVRDALEHRAGVDSVEVDHVARALAVPSDPLFGAQWGLTTVRAPEAWDQATGTGVVIAIIDSGVSLDHPDLVGKVVAGHDFVDVDEDPRDVQGHGTHVAGIAAASGWNGQGGIGMAPGATILAVRVLDAVGQGYYSDIASGITWAADHGANVINLSIGGSADSDVIAGAIDYAVGKGVFVACAAGNDGADALSFPARYPSCVAVGATDETDALASFTNTGTGLDVLAPGSQILSTVRGGGYESWTGTSMATPFVSGLAALLMSRGLSRNQALAAIESTAVDMGDPGYDTSFGFGRIDTGAALGAIGSVAALPVDNGAPSATQVVIGSPFTARRKMVVKRWVRVRSSEWRAVLHSTWKGTLSWQTIAEDASTRHIYRYRIRKGLVQRRVVVARASSVVRKVTFRMRRIAIQANDDVGISHVGLSVDGKWIGADAQPADGWSIPWTCTAGPHAFTAHAFDAAGNESMATISQAVTC